MPAYKHTIIQVNVSEYEFAGLCVVAAVGEPGAQQLA